MSENCAVHVFASGPPDEVAAFRRDACAHLAADSDACGLRIVTAEPNAESPRNKQLADGALQPRPRLPDVHTLLYAPCNSTFSSP